MTGDRPFGFRQGDRAEYLAAYSLSRISFVNPAARQEDFGIDFHCVLTDDVGASVVPRDSFYVQVKSKKKDFVIDQKLCRWISHHMSHPLFLAFMNTKRQELTIYSCARLWFLLFMRHDVKRIVLKLDNDFPDVDPNTVPHIRKLSAYDDKVLPYEQLPAYAEVGIGGPIIKVTVPELDANPRRYAEVLAAWVNIDADNVARRRTGRYHARCFKTWSANEVPDKCDEIFYDAGVYGPGIEREAFLLMQALHLRYSRKGEARKVGDVERMIEITKHTHSWSPADVRIVGGASKKV